MARKFTGWHMTAILVSFFSVVVGVNVFMAQQAIGTFGGTVVENSYVASQKFNGWLDQAAMQKSLGWGVKTRLGTDRHILVSVTMGGVPLNAVAVRAIVRHPLGRAPETRLSFVPVDDHWVSSQPLPAGRWLVHLAITRGDNRYQSVEALR